MSPIEGEALAEEDADDLAPWSMPGIEEESLDEPQATRVTARTAAVPAAARARRRTVGREEVNM
ncbi:hypothetical protein [Streptomyces fildesensis]|uniref:hypothetical protein n=1 Tax=Streptomyces fildesensis TaxID=375757 RepID=UPI001E30FA78|nr:hypothetical protein [Streptomyces fildesensis]